MITHISHTLAQQIVNTIKVSAAMISISSIPPALLSPVPILPESEPFMRLDERLLLPALPLKWQSLIISPEHGRESICPFIMRITFWL